MASLISFWFANSASFLADSLKPSKTLVKYSGSKSCRRKYLETGRPFDKSQHLASQLDQVDIRFTEKFTHFFSDFRVCSPDSLAASSFYPTVCEGRGNRDGRRSQQLSHSRPVDAGYFGTMVFMLFDSTDRHPESVRPPWQSRSQPDRSFVSADSTWCGSRTRGFEGLKRW